MISIGIAIFPEIGKCAARIFIGKGKCGKLKRKGEGKRGNYMNYKRAVMELLEQIGEDDIIFLRQLYTIIKKHIDKRKSW